MRNKVFVHLPFHKAADYIDKIERLKIQPELYFSSDVLDNLSTENLHRLRETLEKNRLSCTIHAPFMDLNLGSPDSIIEQAVMRRYQTLVPVVEILKPVCIVIHTGYDRWRYNSVRNIWLKNAVKNLKNILSILPQGTRLALENVFDESPDVLSEITGYFGKEVGICLDIGHLHLFSKSPLEEWLNRVGNRIIEAHIHDNDGREDRHWEIGKGSAPVFTFLNWAKGKGIILTIEAHTEREALASFRKLEPFL